MTKYFVDSDLNNDEINIIIGDKYYGRIYHYLNRKKEEYEKQLKELELTGNVKDLPIYYRIDSLIGFIDELLKEFYN